MLGKYWALFLIAGMAVAVIVGAGDAAFLALARALCDGAWARQSSLRLTLWWFVSERGGPSYAFMRDTVVVSQSFGAALCVGALLWSARRPTPSCRFIFLAALRPSRAALAEMVWPADDDSPAGLIVILVPLVLPALVNLALPYRLTADWTYPNWALLPVVLYASRDIVVDERAVARRRLVALAVTWSLPVASPIVAYARLTAGDDSISAAFPASRRARRTARRQAGPAVSGARQKSPRGCRSICRRRAGLDDRPVVGRRPRGDQRTRARRRLPERRRAVPARPRARARSRRRAHRRTPRSRARFLGFARPADRDFEITVVAPASGRRARTDDVSIPVVIGLVRPARPGCRYRSTACRTAW